MFTIQFNSMFTPIFGLSGSSHRLRITILTMTLQYCIIADSEVKWRWYCNIAILLIVRFEIKWTSSLPTLERGLMPMIFVCFCLKIVRRLVHKGDNFQLLFSISQFWCCQEILFDKLTNQDEKQIQTTIWGFSTVFVSNHWKQRERSLPVCAIFLYWAAQDQGKCFWHQFTTCYFFAKNFIGQNGITSSKRGWIFARNEIFEAHRILVEMYLCILEV